MIPMMDLPFTFVRPFWTSISLLKRFAIWTKSADLVKLDLDLIREKGYEVVEGSLLKVDGQVRHDPVELSRLILDHYLERSRAAA